MEDKILNLIFFLFGLSLISLLVMLIVLIWMFIWHVLTVGIA